MAAANIGWKEAKRSECGLDVEGPSIKLMMIKNEKPPQLCAIYTRPGYISIIAGRTVPVKEPVGLVGLFGQRTEGSIVELPLLGRACTWIDCCYEETG